MSPSTNPVLGSGRCRRRSACENCQRRKERCDGLQPCGRCRKRRVEGECTRRSKSNNHPRHQQSNYLDHQLGDGGSNSTDDHSMQDVGPTRITITSGLSISSSHSGSTVGHLSRLIRDRHGEYIFVGHSANLSVLQSIRHLVGRALDTFPFAEEPAESDLVEEDPMTPVNWTEASVEPPRPSEEDAQYCLRWYAIVTNCVFDLFSHEELATEIIPWLKDPAAAHHQNCINFLVLAIGAQCGPQNRDAQAETYFTYGRYLAMSQFLETPSISTVQIYSLLAMYLVNASRRNAAGMLLGVAVRAAYALGIHRADVSALFPAAQESTRERVWKVLRVLDLLLSASLGQQPSTTETRDTPSQKDYSASTDLCNIFEKILSEIYTKQEVSSSVLHRVSKHHREWAAHFHEGLRVDRISAEEYLDSDRGRKQPNIGLYHLKEAYYWTIMLVTRPYLMDLVQSRIANASDPLPRGAADNLSLMLSPQSDTLLAHASLNAAMLTIELLQGLLCSKEIPRRLPYVVNSIFISALLLGVGFFADLDRVFPLGQTLLKAEKLLDRFQLHDAVARRNLAIVRSLHNACNEFVKRRSERWLKHQSLLIGGLFGDVKSHHSHDTRTFRDSPSSMPITVPVEKTAPNAKDGLITNGAQSLQQTNDLSLENTALWGDLFWDDPPSQSCGPEIQLGESQDRFCQNGDQGGFAGITPLSFAFDHYRDQVSRVPL